MKTVYISSSYDDLKDHRRAATDSLRNCGYDVDAMEKHPTRDERPKAACEQDAAACDIYIGIFAWRYGHIPTEDNPEGKSITELEYLAAGRAGKPRLIFLLSDNFPWPSSLRDAEQQEDGGKRIRELRTRLRIERWVASFGSPDDLAKQILISVLQYQSTKPIASLAAIDEIKSAPDLGPSFLPNIQRQIEELALVEFVAIRLGPTPWWNTRLHLVAALASDFTEVRQFVLLDPDGHVLVVASPMEIRRALTKAQPKLEMAYLQSRQAAPGFYGSGDVDRLIAAYPTEVVKALGGAEAMVKQIITPSILRELGIKQQGEILEQFAAEHRPILTGEIVRRHAPFVVLVRDGNLEGVIDRVELASRIASAAPQ